MIRRSRPRPLLVGIALVVSLSVAPSTAQASTLQLHPVSLSFPTSNLGYVLSLYKCAGKTCDALRSTHDAGSSWNVVPTPSQMNEDLDLISWNTYGAEYAYSTINVHFADALNGWIYGAVPTPDAPNPSSPIWANRLWSTHDGGKTWQKVPLKPLSITGGVIQMATHGPLTYLFGGSNTSGRTYILTTDSNVDQWRVDSSPQFGVPAGGTQLEGQFTFAGSRGLFVAGNDRGFTVSDQLSRGGSWSKWNGPSYAEYGASFSPIAAVSSKVLLAEGESAGFVIPPASTVPPNWNRSASWLFISYDAGATFKPFRELSPSYQRSYYALPGMPATPVPGTILLQRATNTSIQLVRSTNWGRTWNVVLNRPVTQVVFTGRSRGFAIAQHGTSQSNTSLFVTNDGGGHWIHVSL